MRMTGKQLEQLGYVERKGEWINLKWNNVTLTGENPSITIVSSGSWQTKTGESRVIPLIK